MPFIMSKSRIFPLALAALTLGSALGSTGCDTLRARARAQKGVDKYRNGDIKGAAQLFTEAAAIDPTVPPIIINRGYTHLALYQQFARTKEGQEAANIAVASFKQYMNMPDLKPDQRQTATAVATGLLVARGVLAHRVHNVASARQAALVAVALAEQE